MRSVLCCAVQSQHSALEGTGGQWTCENRLAAGPRPAAMLTRLLKQFTQS